ncbi:MAG: diadenylate cyclase [Desulfobacteraceae bacterium]|nr:MAG: diadenylate cyclase [Desulfobacteraceae bacterium]
MRDFLFILLSLRWTDLIDIAFISYVLFRLYVLFRGTPVLRVLIGIAILWLFQRIAAWLNLVVTSWTIQGIIAAAAIILIVIFRNEIRSVLQAKNLRTLLWGYAHKELKTPNEIISESVFALAKRHHGALIAFELKDDLKEVVHSGIPWDGIISREMILSIFWPDNPVHDGAAIIEGNRVSQVGAILPVSGRKDLPSHYGTRHRAAAGLAERTDALVIVVSEESGRVAVARDGKLRNLRGKNELARFLEEYLSQDVKAKGLPKKRQKLELSAAALASFLFVTAIWFGFTRGMDTLVTLDVPIEYMNRPQKMEILEASVNTVRFQLSGSGAILKSIGPDQVQVRLDMSKAVVGQNSFTITQENIKLPPGVLTKKVEPSVVDVTLDVQVKKELPVQVDWIGTLPDHLTLTEVKIEPKKIDVIGGRSILEKISTIYTEKVRLDTIEKSGEIIVNLALRPASLKIAESSKGRVKIKYVLEERFASDAGK